MNKIIGFCKCLGPRLSWSRKPVSEAIARQLDVHTMLVTTTAYWLPIGAK